MDLALRPFQKHGVDRLKSRRNYLLADDPGVGKTPQAVMAVEDDAPVLVACPASIKGVWAREFSRWRPEFETLTVRKKKDFRFPKRGQVMIVSYDMLPPVRTKMDAKFWIPPDGMHLIGDEATSLKSNKSRRHNSFKAISRNTLRSNGKVWLLSGTPIINHPYELWNMLQCASLETEAFGSFGRFMYLFNGKQGRFGIVYGEPKPEVRDCLGRVMLRRTKREVLPELPPVQFNDIPVEIPDDVRKVCDKAWEALKENGVDLEGALDLADATAITGAEFDEVAKARKALAVSKVSAMLETIETYEEAEEPLVVFSAHRAPIEVLENREGWAAIHGQVDADTRTRVVEDFQAGRLKGIALTIQAGGMGLTLTRASNGLFVDLAWTPAMNRQAQDRLDRMGQTRGVMIHRLVADHAIDQRVTAVLTEKMRLIHGTVGEGPVAVPMDAFEATL